MKKLKLYSLTQWLIAAMVVSTGFIFQACDDNPDEYESAGGVPTVHYVRVTDPAKADSLLDAAFMENVICLVGDNMRSIRKMFFNDQEAVLNTSFITNNTLIVTIPKTIPTNVTNKIYLVGAKDTVSYDFKVLVPSPLVKSISCEYAHDGDVVELSGDYFIDDPNVPLSISMSGNLPVTEILSIEKTKVKFVVPEGSQKGYINVKSIYGTSRSKFQFRDDRGFILDWDNLNANGGWRAGVLKENDPVPSISGKYVYFAGNLKGDNSDWNEDGFSFNLWGTANGRPQGDLFDIPLSSALLKFEINVPQAWSACALQMIFTPWGTSGTNGYIADNVTPRGLWYPWQETGSYTTDGWVTVTMPLSDFKYNHIGGALEAAPVGGYGGLTFFVYHGGVTGTDCSPIICIDNIRVVPAE
jgi:hypothetical protein